MREGRPIFLRLEMNGEIMTKEVMVTISGFQLAEEEEDAVELVHIGEYYERNGTHYILFEEVMEGLEEPVKNMIKIKERRVEVQKKGPVTYSMVFEEGRSQSSTYAVPYGSFLIETLTNSVHIRREEERIEVSASYELDINGAHCADCDIRIKVESREGFRL